MYLWIGFMNGRQSITKVSPYFIGNDQLNFAQFAMIIIALAIAEGLGTITMGSIP
jgi:hypothetical protein